MAEPVQGGGTEHFVGGEGIAPFTGIEVAGEDRGGSLVAFGDQVVKGLVLGRAQGFEAEIVDDEQRDVDQGLKAALVVADGLGLAQAGEQVGLGREQHVVPLTGDQMADGLGEMAFPGATGADDEHGDLFLDEAAGGQIVHQGPIQAEQAVEVETLQGFLAAKIGAAQALSQFFLLAAGHLVVDLNRPGFRGGLVI